MRALSRRCQPSWLSWRQLGRWLRRRGSTGKLPHARFTAALLLYSCHIVFQAGKPL
jgi:hypothetical protein